MDKIRQIVVISLITVLPSACAHMGGDAEFKKTAFHDIGILRGQSSAAGLSGKGTIRVESPSASLTGTVLLAVDGERFRLVVVDAANRAVEAFAGEAGKVYRVDAATGVKSQVEQGEDKGYVSIAGTRTPLSLLGTLITGAPPVFGEIITARPFGGGGRITTGHPSMELVYAGSLKEIILMEEPEKGAGIAFGPVVPGPRGRHISGFKISAPGSSIAVEWTDVDLSAVFPPGFFTFDDEPEQEY
ncbi:MAG: hypothetical protein HY751_04800 [Nitrospinae bacterium]|nr:hypothetical protein [Nitrospinota bacterium]